MRISAVIPTHGRPGLIGSALTSVTTQTRLPDELLVVDDLGDAETESIVAGFAAAAPFPTRYIRNRRILGACGSRNLGGLSALSEWVAFLDDDDVWRPRHLELAERAAVERGVDFVLTGLVRRQQNKPDEIRFMSEGLTPQSVFSEPGGMTGSNFVVSRQSFGRVHGFDPGISMFDDWDLFIRLLQDGQSYAVVREPLVEWRDHGGDRISSTPSLRRAEGIDIFVSRYRNSMSAEVYREMRTTSLGIRRRNAGDIASRVGLAVQLAFAHTPMGLLKRLGKRLGRSATR
jgi:glycosyltransferase involved in cell wall biosynthesis